MKKVNPRKSAFSLSRVLACLLCLISLLLTLLAIIALTAAPYGTLMPAIVHEAFGGDAQKLGFLVGAAGMGAVGGTLLLASRSDVRGLTRFIVAAAFVAAGSIVMR